jgi:hypothetical protein
VASAVTYVSSTYLTIIIISDWDYIEGRLKLDFHLYFKGNMRENRAEKGIDDCLRVDYSTIIGEMVDNKQNSNWTKEGWACFQCLSEFFRDMLPAWWLEKKRKGQSHLPKLAVITAGPKGLLLGE